MTAATKSGNFFHHFFCLVLILSVWLPVQAQNNYRFSGLISAKQTGEKLDYASISVDEARYGTLSQNGRFSLILPAGKHKIKISHLGYESIEEEIILTANTERNYQLEEEIVVLDQVIISSDGRDPAYAIIKQAIDNKKQNAIPFPEYDYEAYTKAQIGFPEGFDLDSMMKSFIESQSKGNAEADSFSIKDELPSNILFLSENISHMYIKAPNKVREEIESTRISGASEQFSPLGNTFNRFDAYENRAFKGGIAERGIISPISDNAFFYYKYKLLGQIKAEGQIAYKILIIPKRIHDPVFQGLIYIADSSYAVQKLDMFVSKEQAIQVVDTLRIQQEYRLIDKAWLPLSTRTHMAFSFNFQILKFPIVGTFTSLLSEYSVGESGEKKKFNLERISFADTALYKDKLWWDSIRPMPLSEMESLDYRFKDSVEQIRTSPEYLDSLTRAQKFTSMTLMMGGTLRNFRKKTAWRFSGLGNTSGFNAIEGAYIGQGIDRIWEREGNRNTTLGYRLRYGFGNKILGFRLALDVDGNKKRSERFGISGGNFVQQFSRPDQINMNLGSLFATFFKRSYVRLYRKEFVEAYYNRELFNGFRLSLNGRYENRSSLRNSTNYSLFFKDREYDPNIQIPRHQALITEAKISFKPFNKYMSLPDDKVNMGSGWPLLEFVYSRSWAREDTYTDFERIQFTLSQQLNLGIFGNTSIRGTAGKYLNDDRVFFPDLFHYQGNEIYIQKGPFDEFFLMPYYEFSSTKPYLEAHLEHAFGGFIFNKIPGIRKWKLSEYVGLHLLAQEGGEPYLELNAGISKRILKVIPLRIDFNVRLNGNTRGDKYGFKIYDPGIVGNNGAVNIGF